jgi:ribosomal-protein-alanine N-acetyltransferase
VRAIPLPIQTERLLVRSFVAGADSRAMVEVYCDPEVMRFIPGGALSDHGAVQSALEAHARAQESRGFSSWAVVERENKRVIGDVGFGIFEPTGDIELGYALARDCWGRGYATEAAAACLAAGLRHLGAPRIVAPSMQRTKPRSALPSGSGWRGSTRSRPTGVRTSSSPHTPDPNPRRRASRLAPPERLRRIVQATFLNPGAGEADPSST